MDSRRLDVSGNWPKQFLWNLAENTVTYTREGCRITTNRTKGNIKGTSKERQHMEQLLLTAAVNFSR